MARRYEIPSDTNEKEKAIGGVLTFVQFFWLLGGAIIGFFTYLFFMLITRNQIVSLFPGIIIALSGVPFAFIKKYKMPLGTYLITKRKFNKKTKQLIKRRTQ